MQERCLWYCHCGLVTAIVHAVHLVTEQQIHAAAYSETKPSDLGYLYESARRFLLTTLGILL